MSRQLDVGARENSIAGEWRHSGHLLEGRQLLPGVGIRESLSCLKREKTRRHFARTTPDLQICACPASGLLEHFELSLRPALLLLLAHRLSPNSRQRGEQM